jgi:hypothetical protein
MYSQTKSQGFDPLAIHILGIYEKGEVTSCI